MKLQCDQCNCTFNIHELTEIKKEVLNKDVERHYIDCPNCKQKYTTHYENDAIKKLTTEIRLLQKKAPLKVKQKNKLNRLRKKVRMLSDTLRMEVESNES
jgi:hypothetical protein